MEKMKIVRSMGPTMSIFWCISTPNNAKLYNKFNEMVQMTNFSVFCKGEIGYVLVLFA